MILTMFTYLKQCLQWIRTLVSKFEFTCGTLLAVFISVILFCVSKCLNLSPHVFTLGPSVVVNGHDGMGWFSLLDLSEARASILDKKMPFRQLRMLVGALYIPASIEERRKTQDQPFNPPPGSYPVQAYAPASSVPSKPHTEGLPQMYEGWQHSTYTPGSFPPPLPYHGHSAHGQGQDHSHEHRVYGHCQDHSHGHCGHGHSDAHGHSHGQMFAHPSSSCRTQSAPFGQPCPSPSDSYPVLAGGNFPAVTPSSG